MTERLTPEVAEARSWLDYGTTAGLIPDDDLRAAIRTLVDAVKPRCDTCGDTRSVRWMIEGDPNCYIERAAEGMMPCPDCGEERSRTPFYGPLVERSCEVMHDAYERAAAENGWSTQEPWADVPEENKATMRTAVAALIDSLVPPAIILETPIYDEPEPSWTRRALRGLARALGDYRGRRDDG